MGVTERLAGGILGAALGTGLHGGEAGATYDPQNWAPRGCRRRSFGKPRSRVVASPCFPSPTERLRQQPELVQRAPDTVLQRVGRQPSFALGFEESGRACQRK